MQEVREATNRLMREVIPQFAIKIEKQLEQQQTDNSYGSSTGSSSNDRFTTPTTAKIGELLETVLSEMHRYGINIRYLGLVRSNLSTTAIATRESTNPPLSPSAMLTSSRDQALLSSSPSSSHQDLLSGLLLTEVVSRSIKNLVRKRMRELRTYQESDYIKLLVSSLNAIFGGTAEEREDYWRYALIPYIETHYEHTLIEPIEKAKKQQDILKTDSNNNNNSNNSNSNSNNNISVTYLLHVNTYVFAGCTNGTVFIFNSLVSNISSSYPMIWLPLPH